MSHIPAPPDRTGLTRRRFLQGAIAAGSATVLDTALLGGAAAEGPPLGAGDRILVLVQLNGGNDGLNTLVPYTSGSYYAMRGGLAIPAPYVLPVGEGLGLHPHLRNTKQLFDAGRVAIVRGAGVTDLDHSHASATSKVMGIAPGGDHSTGWAGRYLDGVDVGNAGGVSITTGTSPVLLGRTIKAISLGDQGGWVVGGDRRDTAQRISFESLERMDSRTNGQGAFGARMSYAVAEAVRTGATLAPAFNAPSPDGRALVRSLTLAASVINLDLGGRIFHVERGGFDNHANQASVHHDLLAELDAGIGAFFAALYPQFRSRVALVTYTEFGRRVHPNGSNGTDHGTSTVMFVVGERVKGGLHGAQPSLTALDSRGDLAVELDTRSVIASILAGWLRADDREILGKSYERLDLFSDGPSCAAAATHAVPDAKGFKAVTPVRILDTRVGNGSAAVKLGPGETRELLVAGRGSVPAHGASAVVLNVTATDVEGSSYLTVWPTGDERPNASSLNFAEGMVVPNLVITKLGRDGKISLYNERGAVNVIADVTGWFPSTGNYRSRSPLRVLDTRVGLGAAAGKIPSDGVVRLAIAGVGGVPAGADAVVLNVTADDPDAIGYLTVWPTGEARPNASNLNLKPQRTAPNLVVSKLGSDGSLSIYNFGGNVHVIADLCGWFPAASGYHPQVPYRILDTRIDVGAVGRVGARRTLDLDGTCRGRIPVNARAVVMNVTVVDPTQPGYMTVWPSGAPQPYTSSLNFAGGAVVPNLVVSKLGEGGMVSFYNDSGEVHLIADVMGWFE